MYTHMYVIYMFNMYIERWHFYYLCNTAYKTLFQILNNIVYHLYSCIGFVMQNNVPCSGKVILLLTLDKVYLTSTPRLTYRMDLH